MINLLHGNCLELMKSIPNGSIDAIITDPPYGTTACKWDSVIPFDLMWEQLNRIIKPKGAIVLFGSEPFSSALRMSNIKNYKYDWIWEKERPSNFASAKYQPLRYTENVSVFYSKAPLYIPQMTEGKKNNSVGKGVRKKINESNLPNSKTSYQNNPESTLKYPKNILNFQRGVSQVHPTQKPVLLMEYLIKTYTNEKETVLDFTMGSGTTGVACVNTKRNFIGIEMDDNYFEIAKKRIN
jgi:site-specific DNA-methyltransferase (adenine-specific)